MNRGQTWICPSVSFRRFVEKNRPNSELSYQSNGSNLSNYYSDEKQNNAERHADESTSIEMLIQFLLAVSKAQFQTVDAVEGDSRGIMT